MPIDPRDWYESNPDYAVFNQGDILDNVPTVVMPPASATWVLLRPAPPITIPEALRGSTPRSFRPRPEPDVPDAWVNGAELVLAKGVKRRVMLVNHGCDIDNRSFYQLASVFPATELGAAKRDSLRENEIAYMFFLPAHPPAVPNEQFADLSQLNAVHKSYLKEAILVQRLSARATFELQRHLSMFYGRPFGFSTKDSAQDGDSYVCANCFFLHATLQRQTMVAGSSFTSCSQCGDNAVWLKAPEATVAIEPVWDWFLRLLAAFRGSRRPRI